MRCPSGLQVAPLSPARVPVSFRGGWLPSVATSHRSLDCSVSVYEGSVTWTKAHLPSGLSAGAPSRFDNQTSSCVIARFCAIATGGPALSEVEGPGLSEVEGLSNVTP